jgi:hypothetical protein
VAKKKGGKGGRSVISSPKNGIKHHPPLSCQFTGGVTTIEMPDVGADVVGAWAGSACVVDLGAEEGVESVLFLFPFWGVALESGD